MAILGASRGLHVRLELYSCALIPWARRRDHVLHPVAAWALGRTSRRLVSCRQGACENAPDENLVKTRSLSKLNEPLTYYKDDNGATLELIKNNCVDEFAQLSFKVGSSNGGNRIDKSIAQDVEKTAIEFLAGRAFTIYELRKKLRGKKYPVDVVDAVIADIKDRGLLNDGLYAESFSRSRWLSSTWGPRRIKQALLQKGVSEVEVDRATKRVFEDDHGHTGCGHKTQFGISESSLYHLFCQASKQWCRGQNLPRENRRSRIVRWLQYRGFNWAVTNAIIKRLEAQYPP